MLQSIRKEIDVGAVRRIVREAVLLGMLVKAFFLHSLPGESQHDLRQTRELMYDLRSYSRRVRSIWAMTVVYPGTELEVIARQEGSLPRGFSWNQRPSPGTALGAQNGWTPYFAGARLSPAEIRQYAKQYRPRWPKVVGRRIKRLLMRLPLGRRWVR